MSGIVRVHDDSSTRKFLAFIEEGGKTISRGTVLINNRPDGLGKVGIIEDVWTDNNHRKKGLASKIIQELIDIANDFGAYKIVLGCSDDNMAIYHKFGFVKWQNSMRKDL